MDPKQGPFRIHTCTEQMFKRCADHPGKPGQGDEEVKALPTDGTLTGFEIVL
jgi:hypothetical protein